MTLFPAFKFFWEIVPNGLTAPVFSEKQFGNYLAFCAILVFNFFMKHFNGIETFIPNGKMLGPITQFLLNQNVGLNLAPLRLGTNFQIKFNFLMSFPGILVSHSHSQKLGRQFSFPFPSPKFGNGLSYSCSQNPKSHSSG